MKEKCQKNKTKEGWPNKPKGLIQVLWERGFVDGTKWKSYSKQDNKEAFGNLVDSSSLYYLMSIKKDFIEEKNCCNAMEKN